MTGNTNKIYQSADKSVVRNSRAEKLNLKSVATPPAASGALGAFSNATTDKYYANNSGVPGGEPVAVADSSTARAVAGRISTLTDEGQLPGAVTDIVNLLSSGAAPVNVPITEDLVSQLRTSLEIRAGNEEITREQYNDVVFEVLPQEKSEPEVEVEDIVDVEDAEESGHSNCPTGPPGEQGEPGRNETDTAPRFNAQMEKEMADSSDEELTALEAFLAPDKEETSRGELSPVTELNPEDLSDLFSGEAAVFDDDDDDDDE